MLIDTHEPSDLVNLIFSAIKEAEFSDLNVKGFADYKWPIKSTGTHRQYERKTWKDLFTNLDDVEFQLFRQIQAHPDVETCLLVEGIVRPHPKGAVMMKKSRSSEVLVPSGMLYGSLHKVKAWLHQVEDYMRVEHTFDYEDTAISLASWYDNDQKEQHTTFHRHLKKINFTPNPQVSRLLGLAHNDTGIGITLAERLIGRFGTVYGVAAATPEDIAMVDGISVNSARNFLRKIGRPDVV